MSDDLYPTRLRYMWPRGLAKLDGVTVEITQAPDLDGAVVEAIDYAPGACYLVRWQHSGWMEMTAAEIAAAKRYLQRVCGAQGEHV